MTSLDKFLYLLNLLRESVLHTKLEFSKICTLYDSQLLRIGMYQQAEVTDAGGLTPPWRLPESKDTSFDLCDICCRIDFAWLVINSLASLNPVFSQIELGSFEEISRKRNCAFCRLVVHTIENALSIDNPAGPVQSCTLFNESLDDGQDSNVYVIKIWPIHAEHYWNESHLPCLYPDQKPHIPLTAIATFKFL